ncbi:Pc20g14070 [Penicillium rubens Wisconsin 54-1255]|uniref:Pc20g14070 protein n=1 Tax=Penicillium rubens (strain ATCC 28089 / DSM 1075 / NRRL 1951 / Wisconsin 54-1255) TaxID=500485 RepID=B6HH93_PENRW|nr:Pc20g14070 [Penicillium rubens Wisconsin 54-1255]
PFELWGCISSCLPNSDIKNLCLSCVQFKNASILRIDRVFLSAHPLNVEVFRCIAGHDKFRHGVTEIIWDEVRLARGPHGFNESAEGNENFSDEDEAGNTREWAQEYGSYSQEQILERHEFEDGSPKWFKHACEENLDVLRQRRGRDVDRPDHIARREQVFAQPALSERWKYYQHLLGQQKDVLADNSDVHAFL